MGSDKSITKEKVYHLPTGTVITALGILGVFTDKKVERSLFKIDTTYTLRLEYIDALNKTVYLQWEFTPQHKNESLSVVRSRMEIMRKKLLQIIGWDNEETN